MAVRFISAEGKKRSISLNQCYLVRQVRTPPVRPADGVVGWFYESFVPAKTWPWGGGEDKVCGCRLNPSLISEVLSSLAARCISQSGSVLRRLYLRPQPQTATSFHRDERLIYTQSAGRPVRWPPRPLAAPSAGRTGGALACLTKSRLNSSLYIAFLSIVII